MKVVIRADASLQIGTGHVMRCLTLANALKKQGAEIEFICRAHQGNLIEHIELQGFKVHGLCKSTTTVDSAAELKTNESPGREGLYGVKWLGTTQQEDAVQSKPVLNAIKPDWLIIDHCAINQTWQRLLEGACKKLMVIDDLADREHQCDVLLDQTYGREPKEYADLVPENCQLLLGSKYALLRPEFAQWRSYSLQRRAQPELKKLLITMGGVDPDNITGQILDKLKTCTLPREIEITVVMGLNAPCTASVIKQAEAMPFKTHVKTNVSNMAEIMANSDLAIGAAGATTWERCCLGLPSLQVVVAKNQINIAEKLSEIHAVKYLRSMEELFACLESIWRDIRKMVLVASSLTSACGTHNIVECLVLSKVPEGHVLLEPISATDCDYVYGLQTKQVRKYFRNRNVPNLIEHTVWFNKALNSKYCQMFVLNFRGDKVGMLRVDNIHSQTVEISIIVSPNFSGQGLGRKALKALETILFSKKLKAVIHRDNIPSHKIFEAAGFELSGRDGEFVEYYKDV